MLGMNLNEAPRINERTEDTEPPNCQHGANSARWVRYTPWAEVGEALESECLRRLCHARRAQGGMWRRLGLGHLPCSQRELHGSAKLTSK